MERNITISDDAFYNLCFAVYKTTLLDLDCALRGRNLYGTSGKPDSVSSYIKFLKYSPIADFLFDDPIQFVDKFVAYDKMLIKEGKELSFAHKSMERKKPDGI